MKLAIKIALGVIGLLFLLAALVAVLPWWPVARDGFGADRYADYPERGAVPLDLSDGDVGFVLPADTYDARLVMLGEVHGYALPQALDLALLRHLNEKAGVRWYLAEIDPAQAMAFNEYVAGGSGVDARQVFDAWAASTAQWGNREFFGKLTAIREDNAARAPSQQVRFVGIDAPQDISFARRIDAETDGSGRPDLSDPATAEAVNAALLTDALAEPEASGRYAHMLRNVERLLAMPGARNETFYGLWGHFHTIKTGVEAGLPLAAQLGAEGGPLEGGVVTITTLCVADCFNMMPSAAMPPPMQAKGGEPYVLVPMSNDAPYLFRVSGLRDVRRAMGDADAVLFPLDGKDSPYVSGRRLVDSPGYLSMMTDLGIEGSAAEAFDYLIAYRGSPGLMPWKGLAYDVSGRAGGS